MTRTGLRGRWLPAALLLAIALALRSVQFGNPTIQVDEQFYLLVGDRMWHSLLPYVDLWDRKPVGLFAIYAAIRLLGGDGVIQYQLVATCFAAATAFLIHRLALRIAPPWAALAAGGAYLLFLMPNGGDGGQAPVFYNLLVAGAALLIVRVLERARFDRAATVQACAAMALLGLAIQVKYTVIFEGAFFGMALLAAARAAGVSSVRLVGLALLWVAIALTPTGLALACYAAIGQADAFVFANFKSIFLRPPIVQDTAQRLAGIAARTAPLLLVTLIGAWIARTQRSDGNHVLLFYHGWALAALAGFLLFGTYHGHYVLPLLVPFALLAAPALAWRWHGIPVLALLLTITGGFIAARVVSDNRERRGTAIEMRAFADRAALRPGEQLFVFSGDPILYHLTHSPLPTRYAFPTLLSEASDSGSIGIDPQAELRRVLATAPSFVVTRCPGAFAEADIRNLTIIDAALAADYRLVFRQQLGSRQRCLYKHAAQG